VKIRDIKESKQINELDLSSFIGDRGAAGVRSGIDSLLGRATGNQSTEDRMAMDMFIKKFIGNAAASVEQAVKSGLVAKGVSSPASAAQPNATAGTSAPATASATSTPAQATTPNPAQIRQQKQATAAKVAQDQMSANPAPAKAEPAVAQTPAQIRQQKQAAATAALQGQEAPFSKVTPAPAVWSNKRNPTASKRSPIVKQQPATATAPTSVNQPSGFNAQNVMNLPGMKKAVVKKAPAKEPALAENTKFDRLNNVFESMVQEAGQQSISQYIMSFFKKFMNNVDPKAVQAALPKAEALAKEAEASYPKMKAPLTKLAQLGWAVSNQQGEDEPEQPGSSMSNATPIPGAGTTPTPNNTLGGATSATPGAPATTAATPAASKQKEQTVYSQVKGMLDKLDRKGKQRILSALEKSLGGATSAPTKAEPEATTPAGGAGAFGQMGQQLTQPKATPAKSSTGGKIEKTPTGQIHTKSRANTNIKRRKTTAESLDGSVWGLK